MCVTLMLLSDQALVHFIFRQTRRIKAAPSLIEIQKSFKQVVAHHNLPAIPPAKGCFVKPCL